MECHYCKEERREMGVCEKCGAPLITDREMVYPGITRSNSKFGTIIFLVMIYLILLIGVGWIADNYHSHSNDLLLYYGHRNLVLDFGFNDFDGKGGKTFYNNDLGVTVEIENKMISLPLYYGAWPTNFAGILVLFLVIGGFFIVKTFLFSRNRRREINQGNLN